MERRGPRFALRAPRERCYCFVTIEATGTKEAEELIRAARDGSEEALNEVCRRYGGRLHGLIRMRMGPRLRRRLESRDVLQIALLKGVQGIERFDGSKSQSLMAWLGTIAVDEIRDQAKFHGRQKRDFQRETSVEGKANWMAESVRSEVSRLQGEQDRRRLEKAMDSLRAEYREIILLRTYEDLRFSEISEQLHRSADACRMLHVRALRALKSEMKRSSGDASTPVGASS